LDEQLPQRYLTLPLVGEQVLAMPIRCGLSREKFVIFIEENACKVWRICYNKSVEIDSASAC
jgi:hypothetical protein